MVDAASAKAQGDATKAAIASGNASQSTVTTLKTLLAPPTTSAAKSKSEPRPVNKKPAKSGPVKKRDDVSVKVLDDGSSQLSVREQYALATDIINVSLAALTEALKNQSKRVQDPSVNGNIAQKETASPSREVLQARSGNATPVRRSPKKENQDRSPSHKSDDNPKDPASSIVASAECARLGFSFLRSVNGKIAGVKEMPPLQIEKGMLALVSKLLSHGLQTLAIKELCSIKRRLECFGVKKTEVSRTSSRATATTAIEKETLATLFRLDAEFDEHSEILSLAVTYQQYVLKVMCSAGKPGVLEQALQYLDPDFPGSPAALISLQAKSLGDANKASRQLEALSQALLALCPALSSSSDEAALDSKCSLRPRPAFELQMICMRIRKIWWKLAGHQADIHRELLEPLLRNIHAFVRRAAKLQSSHEMLQLVSKAVDSLGPNELDNSTRQSLFSIHTVLFSLSESAGEIGQGREWAEQMKRDSENLLDEHAKRLCAIAKSICMQVRLGKHEKELQQDIERLLQGLGGKITGNSADYDTLIVSLATLQRALRSDADLDSSARQNLSRLAASFALRYSKAYPSRNASHLQTIVECATQMSQSTEDLLQWITDEAPKIFMRGLTLRSVAESAATKPATIAWACSSSAMVMNRILRAMLLRRVRGNLQQACLHDLDDVSDAEKAVMLELELKYAVELASKTKYHNVLRHFISTGLENLSRIYGLRSHPIRRARIAVLVFRLRDMYPQLLPTNVSDSWIDDIPLDPSHLGEDAGLRRYAESTKANLSTSRLFVHGPPDQDQVKNVLLIWRSIIDMCGSMEAIDETIDDLSDVMHKLKSLQAYCAMLGDDMSAISALLLLKRLCEQVDLDSDERCSILFLLENHYLTIGYCEKAEGTLTQLEKLIEQTGVSDHTRLKYQISRAQYQLSITDLKNCQTTLAKAAETREDIPPEKVSRDYRREYDMLHAEGWYVHSRFMHDSGSPQQALRSAKRAVKILNSLWSAVERSTGVIRPSVVQDGHEQPDGNLTELAKGVSKLKLSPNEPSSTPSKSSTGAVKGAAFWPIVPLLVSVLRHLSDVYSHHGLFNEANYYSERSVNICESVGSASLLSRARTHRAGLLILAGQLENAELCLAQDEGARMEQHSLHSVMRLLVRARLRVKDGCPLDAISLYEKVEHLTDVLSGDNFIAELEQFSGNGDELIAATAALAISSRVPKTQRKAPAKRGAKPPTTAAKVSARGSAQAKAAKNTKISEGTGVSSPSGLKRPYLLSKLRHEIRIEKAIVRLQLGEGVGSALVEIDAKVGLELAGLKSRHVKYLDLFTRAAAFLEKDVTLNVLSESALSFPSLLDSNATVNEQPRNEVAPPKVNGKSARSKKPSDGGYRNLLLAARECLVDSHAKASSFYGTVETHLESAMLSSASLLLYATSTAASPNSLNTVEESLGIDMAKMRALQYEQSAIHADGPISENSEPLAWPSSNEIAVLPTPVAADFQADYIDIIPKPWTAVSLCLNQDCSELYIVRYRAEQSPLILRLPFTRQKPEGVDDEDEPFDFQRGKTELQEIIELSNRSCHNTGDSEGKISKKTWWDERETLDRRLHELLINIENIWLGGFKSILSPYSQQSALLGRFRKAFEDILDRCLPSRLATKGKGKKLVFDDKVLELFVNLGDDHEGEVDLDDCLADLLYFVVDMLQFNGELNAYDEIDFDSMTVDVLDALRAYHGGKADQKTDGQHLVLVLDRRLQLFPWENLPCLEGVSVSRVGSMLSLRECILAMRNSRGSGKLSSDSEGRHLVSRSSGTCSLNPSSDLKATQATLKPALSSLETADGSSWESLVDVAPTEDQFTKALREKSIFLYFGHGAGSQYVRPRAIRKLDTCSEVVWLMGCSSGAVTEHGDLEPSAVPLAYLLAGSTGQLQRSSSAEDQDEVHRKNKCLSVVATLWDVTDKDIDRFSLAIGEAWGLWPAAEHHKLPSKTPRKREVIAAAPATPQQASKAPKTPKVKKTPAPARTPARSRSRPSREGKGKCSIVDAVARSRDACYLRYLNGAAPVVYGVPVYLGD